VRRFLASVALTIVACTPTVLTSQSIPPSARPSPEGTPTTFAMGAELYLEGVPYAVRDSLIANGDESLVFKLAFNAEMDAPSAIAAVTSHLPDATSFSWLSDGRTLRFVVPPANTAFTIDPRGARTLARPNIGVVSGVVWNVSRPRSVVNLYRPEDLATGNLRAAASYTFDFAADTGLVRVDATRDTALVSIVTPSHLSFVDLATGARTALPLELNRIGTNGAYMHWLADGRFLTLGSHETVISGSRGDGMRWLPTIAPGQVGWVSPDERSVALQSYPTDAVAIQDLETGAIRDVTGGYKRCSAYASAVVSWSPDARTIAIGSCALDMEGPGRTAFIDVASLGTVRTLDDWSVIAWLPDGTMLARAWPEDGENYMRQPDPRIAVLDAGGRVIRRIESRMPYGLSPDGRWLADGGVDPQDPHLRLIDVKTGRAYPADVGGGYPSWTPDGLLAVLFRT
jgi:hypothetical protein